MKYSLTVIIFFLVVSLGQTPVFSLTPTPFPSVEYTLPYPGLLADHPLYPVKVLRDRILIFLTFNPVKRVHLNLLLADKRLVMGQLLWEKGNFDLAINAISKGEKYLLTAALNLQDLKKQGSLPPGLADKLELAAKKHEEIIMRVESATVDESKRHHLNLALGVTHQAMQQIASVK